jgi:hypothetical protein
LQDPQLLQTLVHILGATRFQIVGNRIPHQVQNLILIKKKAKKEGRKNAAPLTVLRRSTPGRMCSLARSSSTLAMASKGQGPLKFYHKKKKRKKEKTPDSVWWNKHILTWRQ